MILPLDFADHMVQKYGDNIGYIVHFSTTLPLFIILFFWAFDKAIGHENIKNIAYLLTVDLNNPEK